MYPEQEDNAAHFARLDEQVREFDELVRQFQAGLDRRKTPSWIMAQLVAWVSGIVLAGHLSSMVAPLGGAAIAIMAFVAAVVLTVAFSGIADRLHKIASSAAATKDES